MCDLSEPSLVNGSSGGNADGARIGGGGWRNLGDDHQGSRFDAGDGNRFHADHLPAELFDCSARPRYLISDVAPFWRQYTPVNST